MAITIEKIPAVKNKLGEGPVWDVADKALYWIDGSAPAIYRLDPKTNDIKSWKPPKRIGSFALREKGGAVLALSDGFYLFDFESGEAKQIGEPAAKPGTTFNDGKTDARGRFIAGTLDSKFAQPIGSIFSLDASLKCTTLEPAIGCTNGPCFSPDNRTFYCADSVSRTISAWFPMVPRSMPKEICGLRSPAAGRSFASSLMARSPGPSRCQCPSSPA